MVAIQVDEQTAAALQKAAETAGVSLADYVKSLVDANPREPHLPSWESLEKEFVELSVEGSLPPDFSRADIYSDHDWHVGVTGHDAGLVATMNDLDITDLISLNSTELSDTQESSCGNNFQATVC